MVENTHKVGSKSKIGATFMFLYLQVLWVTVSVEESEEYTMDDRDRVMRAEISVCRSDEARMGVAEIEEMLQASHLLRMRSCWSLSGSFMKLPDTI